MGKYIVNIGCAIIIGVLTTVLLNIMGVSPAFGIGGIVGGLTAVLGVWYINKK